MSITSPTSPANIKSSTQPTEKAMQGFLKMLSFYLLSFTFWIGLFINNEGPGGVELQHLILMGVCHAMLIFIHFIGVFQREEENT
ncbi:MAG: hypothetical protein MJK12_08870 [Colwellia sp.]|nr:hypothetical protein [Colwellia sp.]